MNPTRLYKMLMLAAVGAMLAGCVGVPLSTLWHFRNFSPKNLVQTDSAQVRGALRSWSDLDLNGGAPQMHVTLQFEGGQPQNYEMPMSLVTGKAAVAQRLPNPGLGYQWYIFALSPTGVSTFRKMQHVIEENMDASGKLKRHLTLTLEFNIDQMRPSLAANRRIQKAKKIPVQIRLELSPKEGYYTLYSGKIPMKNGHPTASGSER